MLTVRNPPLEKGQACEYSQASLLTSDSSFHSPLQGQPNAAQMKEGCMGRGSAAFQTGLEALLSRRSSC